MRVTGSALMRLSYDPQRNVATEEEVAVARVISSGKQPVSFPPIEALATTQYRKHGRGGNVSRHLSVHKVVVNYNTVSVISNQYK